MKASCEVISGSTTHSTQQNDVQKGEIERLHATNRDLHRCLRHCACAHPSDCVIPGRLADWSSSMRRCGPRRPTARMYDNMTQSLAPFTTNRPPRASRTRPAASSTAHTSCRRISRSCDCPRRPRKTSMPSSATPSTLAKWRRVKPKYALLVSCTAAAEQSRRHAGPARQGDHRVARPCAAAA